MLKGPFAQLAISLTVPDSVDIMGRRIALTGNRGAKSDLSANRGAAQVGRSCAAYSPGPSI